MTGAARKLWAFTRAPWNAAAFGLRRRLRWSRGQPELRREDKGGLFDYLEAEGAAAAERRELELRERYALAVLREHSTRHDYRDNLWLIDALEAALDDVEPAGRQCCRAVDVGSQNWRYVYGLHRFLARWSGDVNAVELSGVEVDGHGIYPDWRSRRDWAMAYVAQLGEPDVHYEVTDFTVYRASELDVVTVFYPFLERYPLLAWGLPLRLFRPRALIDRCLAVLRPGGLLVVFTQTDDERDTLRELLDQRAEEVTARRLDSKLVAYWQTTCDRWAVVLRRRRQPG